MEGYNPPQNFQPAGQVTIETPAESSISVDAVPTQNSTHPVSSGGVFAALSNREPKIQSPTSTPEEYVLVGDKTWVKLSTWIQQLLEAALAQAGGVHWENIEGKPSDFLLEESDPTVPEFVKSITEEQKEALAWFSEKFSRESLTPGHVVVIGQDGDSLQIMPLGELLTPFFPALSSVLSGVVAPITSVTVVQRVSDVVISWTDIPRKAGYYEIEIRHRVNNGEWSEYIFVNAAEYSEKEHIWPRVHIPANMTHVGVRVRYKTSVNDPSEWKTAETSYNYSGEVVTETVYERVPFSGRWYSASAEIVETQYERVPFSGRWWTETVTPENPGESTPNAPNPIVVTRNAANQINVTIPLELPHNPLRLFEVNYRVVGTEVWRVYTNTGLVAAPATAALLSGPTNGQANFSFLLQNAYFTQGRIEARARSWQNSVASPWSTIVAEPSSGGGGGGGTTLPSSYVLKYYMSQANGFLDLVVERGTDGLPYISDNGGNFGKANIKYQVMGADVVSTSQPFNLQDYLVPINEIFMVNKRGCNDFATWWSASNGNYEHQVAIWIEPVYT